MRSGTLEHVNLTVRDPDKTAALLCGLFSWKVRWRGPASFGGYTVHIGSDDSYVAVYSPDMPPDDAVVKNLAATGLNHIGVVVDNIEDVEKRVIEAGFQPNSHGDYEPGRRFYFHDGDGIEYEVVSYTRNSA